MFKIPGPIKSGLATMVFTFVGLVVPSLLGWLTSLYNFTSANGHGTLPSISTIGYVVASAAISAFTGFITGVWRWAQGRFSWVPGQPPQFVGNKW